MKKTTEVHLPNIGDFEDVEVIEVLVKAGTSIKKEDPLITLESDKASMDVPSPYDGVVKEVLVSVGDKVSEGTLILRAEVEAEEGASDAEEGPKEEQVPEGTRQEQDNSSTETEPPDEAKAKEASLPPADSDIHAEVLVLGGGPGGYTAAFRAADLGKKVVLVERDATLGGVCLNVGCIPSKALLHVAKVIDDAMEAGDFGVTFGKPQLEMDKVQNWKQKVVSQLTGGLASMARQRNISVIEGKGAFQSDRQLKVSASDGEQFISFDHAIIAAGSHPIMIPGLPEDDRIITSTGALSLQTVPPRMLIIGGGIIGLEMATVYSAIGSKITIVEAMKQLIPGADPDLVRHYHKYIEKRYQDIYLDTKVTSVSAAESGLTATFEGSKAPDPREFDTILVSVGRRPNSGHLMLENAGVETDSSGFITVDRQLRTSAKHIFAVGDIVGAPMLAHKASYEGKIAAEVIAGLDAAFDAVVVPSIAYTDPEIAWVGMTEKEAKENKVEAEKAIFPWSASGRSLTMGRKEGRTKLVFEKETGRIIGAGILGSSASELIAELALAIEMGCTAEDISMTIHPHPTLSESVAFSAEIFEGTITDLYLPKKRGK